MEESKRIVDEEFGRKLSEIFSESKKLFYIGVQRVTGKERGKGVGMRGEDGELLRGESALKGLWKGYFEQLMDNEAEREAVVTGIGIEAGRGWVPIQGRVGRAEVEKAKARIKCGKATGMDEITAEMLKYGG